LDAGLALVVARRDVRVSRVGDGCSSAGAVSLAVFSVSLDEVSAASLLGCSPSVAELSSLAAGSSAPAVVDSVELLLEFAVPAPDSNREEPARRALASRSSSELPREARAVRAGWLGAASVGAGAASDSSTLGVASLALVAGGAAATGSVSTGRDGGTKSAAAGMLEAGAACGSLTRLATAAGRSIRAGALVGATSS
jgi:hypothetical protein